MAVYIYSLSDPRTEQVRYIGKTVNMKARFTKHMLGQGANPEKNKWIAELKDLGLRPVMQALELTTTEQWPERECYWIKYGREQGWELLNADDGGRGGTNPKPETLERMRKSHLGKTQSFETRIKVRNAVLGRKASESTREKNRNRLHTWGYKISLSKIGHTFTDAAKQKMSKSKIAYYDKQGRNADLVKAHLEQNPQDSTLSCRALGRKLAINHHSVSEVYKMLGIEVKTRGKS